MFGVERGSRWRVNETAVGGAGQGARSLVAARSVRVTVAEHGATLRSLLAVQSYVRADKLLHCAPVDQRG